MSEPSIEEMLERIDQLEGRVIGLSNAGLFNAQALDAHRIIIAELLRQLGVRGVMPEQAARAALEARLAKLTDEEKKEPWVSALNAAIDMLRPPDRAPRTTRH